MTLKFFGFITILILNCINLNFSTDLPTNSNCPEVARDECCSKIWSRNCPQKHCDILILQKCPERRFLLYSRVTAASALPKDLRRSPPKIEEPKCGTAELNYHACTSKTVANKLFMTCCELYLPKDCHFMCQYETDQTKAKNLLLQVVSPNSKCSLKYLSSILYCASQNRDNRQCCQDLDLNAPQLMIGSRCLRMCDPSGTSMTKVTKDDVTCLFNWNVMMYCHHAGIREM